MSKSSNQASPASSQRRRIAADANWSDLDYREMWEYRDLLYYLVLRDFTVLYTQTILGFSWAIFNPLLSAVIFTFVFGRMVKVQTDGIPYAVFALLGIIPWTYFSNALNGAGTSLIQGTSIFTKVYFPRIFIPLTPVLSKLVDFGISLILAVAVILLYHQRLAWTSIFLPILIFSLVLNVAGMGLWFSALAIQFRDVRFALPFLLQVLMYASPVVWPASLVPHHLRVWYGLYPLGGTIEGFRSLLLGRPMPWDLLIPGCATSLVLLFTGMLYFRHTERKFADVA